MLKEEKEELEIIFFWIWKVSEFICWDLKVLTERVLGFFGGKLLWNILKAFPPFFKEKNSYIKKIIDDYHHLLIFTLFSIFLCVVSYLLSFLYSRDSISICAATKSAYNSITRCLSWIDKRILLRFRRWPRRGPFGVVEFDDRKEKVL